MKLQLLKVLTLSTLAVATLPLTVSAADDTAAPPRMVKRGLGQGKFNPGGGRHRGPQLERRIERLDSNDDGNISKEEFLAPQLAHVDELFARRDANGDGLIEQGEGKPERPTVQNPEKPQGPGGQRPAGKGRPQLDREAIAECLAEANIELPERPERPSVEERFDATDANNDNKLSLTEVTAAITAQAEEKFSALDSNSDDVISSAELAALQEQRTERQAALRACMQAQKASTN
jgi:Ca2+-binding EF-hand superfamily protein